MAYRNLIIGSPAKLSLRGGQLIIRTEAEHSVPIEDIFPFFCEENPPGALLGADPVRGYHTIPRTKREL